MSWDLTAEIAQQRTDAANTYAQTGVISRLAEVSDGQGGMVQAWSVIGTADCRLVANSGVSKEIVPLSIAERLDVLGEYTLTLGMDTDIQTTDRVEIDSYVYRVIFVDNVREWQTAQRCQVNEEI